MRSIDPRFVAVILSLIIWPGLLQSQSVSGKILADVPRLDDLAGKWEIASNLLSLPALNNSLGSGKAAWDAVGIGNLSFPPITMTGDTGALFIDGQEPALEQTRWYAYQVLRRASAGSVGIETAVRMPYEQRGLLFHIALKNNGTKARSFELKITMSAATSRHEHWAWGVPRPKDAASRFTVSAPQNSRQFLLFDDSTDGLANCFSFEQMPDELSTQEHFALWHLTLKPGASTTINYALAVDTNSVDASGLGALWAKQFDASFDAVATDWQQRFDAMFTPHNSVFSGNLPILVTPDKQLKRVYYMSALSLLSVLRTGFPVAPRVYVSNTPESNCTMMYFWDTREWATVFALLDPVTLKNCLRSWLARGIYNGYAEEYLTGELEGPWYSANDYSIFILLNDYLNVTGDRAFLSEKIRDKTVLEHMDAIATHWESLVKPGQTLADYGGKANLLECVPTYINEVASFNAANVWMMRRVADIEEAEGNPARAAELRAKAARLLPAVLALYEPGQGVWDALHNDGSRVQVRHVFDFATIGLTIPNDLTPKMRDEMTDFVERELLTDHWMRAQSLSDVAAAQSNRPDHGPMGAFCAWPAETAATFCEFGEYDKALDVLHRCAWVTEEGPFSQSRELSSREPDALARITARGGSPNSHQTYNASNGGSFAETIIRGLFGYQPDFLWKTNRLWNGLPVGSGIRPFRGELINVRHNNGMENIGT